MSDKKKGLGKGLALGKGLDALIPQVPKDKQEGIIQLPLHQLEPNENQPRQTFDEETLQELADSIENFGMLQPILVRKVKGSYEIIAGERRWRAARMAGEEKVPVIIKEISDKEAMQIAILENIQRDDLNPLEEAMGYKELTDSFGLTHEELAETLGKSRSSITNSLRLLKLSEKVMPYLIEEKISMGHAKLLIPLEEALQIECVEAILKEDLSVRATTEWLKNKQAQDTEEEKPEKKEKPMIYTDLEEDLQTSLKSKVAIKQQAGKDSGKIEISYGDSEELDRLYLLLRNIE